MTNGTDPGASVPAKTAMELMGKDQSTFSDMVSELGLAAALGPKTEYTLLAPVNAAFTGEQNAPTFGAGASPSILRTGQKNPPKT